MRSVYLYPADSPLYAATRAHVAAAGLDEAAVPEWADVAIAPLLTRKLSPAEHAAPRLGTLIFHPSLLPRRRGPDAVTWTVASGDPFAGVTWFWCDDGLDTGDICEQELVAVPAGVSPGRLYYGSLVPAGARALARVLAALRAGYVRRVPQDEAAATYQGRFGSVVGGAAGT